jgi:hypothetical protein
VKTLLRDPTTTLPPGRPIAKGELTLLDVIDRILDKGIVINGDITVSFAGVDILSLKINLVIASLETAKRYGLELPWEKWEKEKAKLSTSGQQTKDQGLPEAVLPIQSTRDSSRPRDSPQDVSTKLSEQKS